MNSISQNLENILTQTKDYKFTLVAVSKTKPNEAIVEAYEAGQRVFGENKVQELCKKQETLPKDIKWHMIGHLQSNKVKYIASFVSLIHAVDSERLLKEINKQALKKNRIINCLLQVHIAQEEHKFGFPKKEIIELLNNNFEKKYSNIKIKGLMGMASHTDDINEIKSEFLTIKELFDEIKKLKTSSNIEIEDLSIGMSGDYQIALETGSTMIRVGSAIFGKRNHN